MQSLVLEASMLTAHAALYQSAGYRCTLYGRSGGKLPVYVGNLVLMMTCKPLPRYWISNADVQRFSSVMVEL